VRSNEVASGRQWRQGAKLLQRCRDWLLPVQGVADGFTTLEELRALTRLSAPEHFTEFCLRETLKTCKPCDVWIYSSDMARPSECSWIDSKMGKVTCDSFFSNLSVCVVIGQNMLIECYITPVRLGLHSCGRQVKEMARE